MAHLRLQAAYCVLKIARVVEYKELFKPEIYQELAMLINVSASMCFTAELSRFALLGGNAPSSFRFDL